MNLRTSFIRLVVDVDLAGNPVGSHHELHHDDAVSGLTVMPCPAPFDTCHEVFTAVRNDASDHYGEILGLW